jgi:hypothetical protein
MDAAKRFFVQALDVAGQTPERVTTDGHDAYPRAIRETLGEAVTHRCNAYLNNRIEQDHRGIKQRYYPMRGFGNVDATARFCRAFEEQRQSLPPTNQHARMDAVIGRARTEVLYPLERAHGRVDGCLTSDQVGFREVSARHHRMLVLNPDAPA